MLDQFMVGGSTIICTVAIHALVTASLVSLVHIDKKNTKHPSMFLIGIMVPIVSALVLAHVVEIVLWALVYQIVDATPVNAGQLYFAFVNYTTLGYGDVVPVRQWQLLGPMTAMDGVLLFGWSTAVLVAVLRKAIDCVYPTSEQK